MRDICEILGVNRSSLYYHPQEDPSEAVLLAEIEKLVPERILHTDIGVSRSCYGVRDTPLGPDASLD